MNKEIDQITAKLGWVDEFIRKIKPYIFVRIEDNVLIKRPNHIQKLNETGALVLKTLLDGIKIKNLLKKFNSLEKTIQINNFLIAIRDQIDNKQDEFNYNPAIEKKAFEMKFTEFPVLSEVAITYRCNLKCKFCYAGCNSTSNPIKSNIELSEDDIKKIIFKIYNQAKVPSISFTGGEPLLRKDLPKLIKYAKKLGMRVNLITNGTLITKDIARILKKSGLDSAQVSIESINKETHDQITFTEDSYDKTIHGIKLLKENDIFTFTNTTLNMLNINESHLFPKFIKEKLNNDRFSMNMIIPTGSTSIFDELELTYIEMGKFIEKILEESKKNNIEFMWYSPIPLCIFNTIVHGLGNKGCSACDGLLSIAPNGDILPCASYDESVGNLLLENFNDIWKNKKVVFFRDKTLAHDICKKCEHFPICNGACPLYWRKKGYMELDMQIKNFA